MKTIILQYPENSELDNLINKALELEQSSRVSLCKRALINYCSRILYMQNGNTKSE